MSAIAIQEVCFCEHELALTPWPVLVIFLRQFKGKHMQALVNRCVKREEQAAHAGNAMRRHEVPLLADSA